MEQLPPTNNEAEVVAQISAANNADSPRIDTLTPRQQLAIERIQREIGVLEAKIHDLDERVAQESAALNPQKKEIRDDLLDLQYLESHSGFGSSSRLSERSKQEIKELKSKIFMKLNKLRAEQRKLDDVIHPLRAERFALARLVALKRAEINEIIAN